MPVSHNVVRYLMMYPNGLSYIHQIADTHGGYPYHLKVYQH